VRFNHHYALLASIAWFAAIACESKQAPAQAAAAAPAGRTAAAGGDASATGPAPVASASAHLALMPREDVAGLPNFAKVSDVLFRGAQPTAEGMRALKAMGVKTVVSLRMAHSDRDMLAGTELQYLRISAKAWHPEDEDVARVLKIIEDPKNQPVFVHCQHGADRTGTMVAAYRMVEQGWTKEEAAAELPNFGYHPVWTQILAYLDRFDRKAMLETVAQTPAPTLDLIR
jgi:protein tyrosine/serine phosphatase